MLCFSVRSVKASFRKMPVLLFGSFMSFSSIAEFKRFSLDGILAAQAKCSTSVQNGLWGQSQIAFRARQCSQASLPSGN